MTSLLFLTAQTYGQARSMEVGDCLLFSFFCVPKSSFSDQDISQRFSPPSPRRKPGSRCLRQLVLSEPPLRLNGFSRSPAWSTISPPLPGGVIKARSANRSGLLLLFSAPADRASFFLDPVRTAVFSSPLHQRTIPVKTAVSMCRPPFPAQNAQYVTFFSFFFFRRRLNGSSANFFAMPIFFLLPFPPNISFYHDQLRPFSWIRQ